MKTMAPLWTLAVIALLVAQTVVGFGIFDVLGATRYHMDSRRDVKTPADVIVDVLLEEIDSNNDGQITLTEVKTYNDRLQEAGMARLQEGYVLTLATIMDADQSGTLERDELKRAAAALVTHAGTIQAGLFIRGQLTVQRMAGTFDPVVKAGEIAGDFLSASDVNKDGSLSTQEIQTLLHSAAFRLDQDALRAMIADVDQNGDEKLNQSETQQWLRRMAEELNWLFEDSYVYARLSKLVGGEVANTWFNSYF